MKNKSKKIEKNIIGILILIAFTAISYGTFHFFGLTSEEGILSTLRSAGTWAYIVYIMLYIIQTMFLQFIPGTGAVLIIVSVAIFGPFLGFIISGISIIITSTILYFIGRTIKEKHLIKLFSYESKELRKAKDLINSKQGKIALPLMMLFPFFPDDTLCFVAGLTRYSYRFFALAVYIPRVIGVGTIAFISSGILILESLTPIQWIMLINIIIIDIYIIWKIYPAVEEKALIIIDKLKKNKKEKDIKITVNKTNNNIDQSPLGRESDIKH